MLSTLLLMNTFNLTTLRCCVHICRCCNEFSLKIMNRDTEKDSGFRERQNERSHPGLLLQSVQKVILQFYKDNFLKNNYNNNIVYILIIKVSHGRNF